VIPGLRAVAARRPPLSARTRRTYKAWGIWIDKKLGGRVRSLVRLIKAWKFYREVPISSFYLEICVTKFAEIGESVACSIDVTRILSLLDRAGLAKLQDPLGISGDIAPCADEARLEEAKSKLSTAVRRAVKALKAEKAGDTRGAFLWWDVLYAGEFPSY
jgi:hypothetical protein